MAYTLRNAKKENLVFSLSRWTDLPAAKWDWFKERLAQGQMIGTCPKTGVPDLYSLHPDDTLGMVFWTRDSRNLIKDAKLLKDYKKVIQFSLTGWHEVEHKAPNIEKGLEILQQTCDTFGPENVVWRFSPVPVVEDVLGRWSQIADAVTKMGIKEVYIAFLQENDNLVETRSVMERTMLLDSMAQLAPDLNVMLCNEDRTLRSFEAHHKEVAAELKLAPNLSYGVCEDSKRFTASPLTEGCGCAKAVDPFTINETCRFGCEFCYAADKSLAPKKRNTTKSVKSKPKSLPVVR